MDDDLAIDQAIAVRLQRTWDPFFARFGRLTPVQREVIPAILNGRDVLVCSPTASGKTEAVCAPVLERLGSAPGKWTVLYVSPTRALVNDLYHRLEMPVAALGQRLVRRTGEHKDALTQPPHVLLTTPESLDSLLCRGRLQPHGHVLAHVRAVVLDEIHLLHASPRGVQLAWLLRRLRRLRTYACGQKWVPGAELQVVALSATVGDPGGVAATYLHEPLIAIVPGQREIEEDILGGAGPTEDALLQRLDGSDPPSKLLVFCNTRRRVDELAARLRLPLQQRGYEVQAHHGSLSQKVREEAEEEVRLSDRIVLFSTSTLEIGIDIGDIDLVVLDAPPPDVASLLQRVGRGNRRRERTTLMACSTRKVDYLLHQALLKAARNGDLGPVHVGPQYAVARQQLASFIFQSPKTWRLQQELEALASECEPELEVKQLIDHLVESGEFVRDADRLRHGEEWLEKASTGAIHSNIEGAPGSDVVDAKSGKVLAHGIHSQSGRTIGVGGKTRVVKRKKDNRIEVEQGPSQGAVDGEWRYAAGRRFVGASQPHALRQHLAVPPDVWPTIVAEGSTFAFHLGGGELGAVLSLLSPGSGHVRATPWYVRLQDVLDHKPRWVAEPDELVASSLLDQRLESLEGQLVRPFANRCLPRAIRLAEVRAWLRLPEALDDLRGSIWVPAGPEWVEVLSELI